MLKQTFFGVVYSESVTKRRPMSSNFTIDFFTSKHSYTKTCLMISTRSSSISVREFSSRCPPSVPFRCFLWLFYLLFYTLCHVMSGINNLLQLSGILIGKIIKKRKVFNTYLPPVFPVFSSSKNSVTYSGNFLSFFYRIFEC